MHPSRDAQGEYHVSGVLLRAVGENGAAAPAATMVAVVTVVAVALDFICIRFAGSARRANAAVFLAGSDWAVVGVDTYGHVVLVHPGVVV